MTLTFDLVDHQGTVNSSSFYRRQSNARQVQATPPEGVMENAAQMFRNLRGKDDVKPANQPKRTTHDRP